MRLRRYQEVKDAARSQWSRIILALCRSTEIHDAITRGPNDHGRCPNPSHPQKNGDAFRVFDDFDQTGGVICNSCGAFPNGFALLQWENGWDFTQAWHAVRDLLNDGVIASVDQQVDRAAPVQTASDTVDDKQKKRPTIARLKQLWEEAVPLDHPDAEPARRYFANRHLLLDTYPQVMRLHPNLGYFEQSIKLGEYPVLLAQLVSPDGQVVGLHHTYLTSAGGKAPVPSVKKMRVARGKQSQGAAIRLFEPGDQLGVSEGIETGLAAYLATGIPVWPTYSSSLLQSVMIPRHVKRLIIWADLDRSQAGRKAAGKLKQRLRDEGRTDLIIQIQYPNLPLNDRKSVDWWDLYVAKGPRAFPYNHFRLNTRNTSFKAR